MSEMSKNTLPKQAKPASVNDCDFIEVPEFVDIRGNLLFAQNDGRLPFNFQRIYAIYQVPDGATRAAHAHRNLHQLFFAFSGSFVLGLYDGKDRREVVLEEPARPFFVKPGIWRDITRFDENTVCVVLADLLYDEDDYIRDIELFRKFRNENGI